MEDTATGHAKCDRCSRLDALEAKFKGRADKEKEIAELRVRLFLATHAHSDTLLDQCLIDIARVRLFLATHAHSYTLLDQCLIDIAGGS